MSTDSPQKSVLQQQLSSLKLKYRKSKKSIQRFIIMFSLLLFVGMSAAVSSILIYSNQSRDNRSKASTEVRSAATLALEPSEMVFVGTEEKSFQIEVDTFGERLAAAQLEISYDPTAVEFVSFVPMQMMGNVLWSENDSERGLLKFAIGTTCTDNGCQTPSSRTPIATLTMRSKLANTSSTLNFIPSSEVDKHTRLAIIGGLNPTLTLSNAVLNTYRTLADVPPVPVADVTPPVVTILQPSDGQVIPAGSEILILADAQDNAGVEIVDMLVNGRRVCRLGTTPYECVVKAKGRSDTTYQIKVIAKDISGNQSEKTITVTSRK